ncbi:hypothetical protein [Yunchengibacter salinarum]|uniref:hypothetical protein n=1 Tax=Yunchengibacter salinarum TaxID=3133399 RepID=UPI0035B5EAE7
MRLIALPASLTALLMALSLAAPAAGAQQTPLGFYAALDFHVSPDKAKKHLSAATWQRIRNSGDKPLQKLTFWLNPGLEVKSAKGDKGMPLGFDNGRGETPGGLPVTMITLHLDPALEAGSIMEVQLSYAGEVILTGPQADGPGFTVKPVDLIAPMATNATGIEAAPEVNRTLNIYLPAPYTPDMAAMAPWKQTGSSERGDGKTDYSLASRGKAGPMRLVIK